MGPVAVSGGGCTPFSRVSGRFMLDPATTAAVAVPGDARLPPGQIDGIVTFGPGDDSRLCDAVPAARLDVAEVCDDVGPTSILTVDR